MKLTIYAYYGILAHEKTPVYSPNKVNGEISEELTVEIPFPVWRNGMDEPGITLDGVDYLLREVLTTTAQGEPALAWISPDGKRNRIKLAVQ